MLAASVPDFFACEVDFLTCVGAGFAAAVFLAEPFVAVDCALAVLGTGFLAGVVELDGTGFFCGLTAAGTGFFWPMRLVDGVEVAFFTGVLVFPDAALGVADAAGFFAADEVAGVLAGVAVFLAAGFDGVAVVDLAGVFDAGDFFGKSLSTILILLTPSEATMLAK